MLAISRWLQTLLPAHCILCGDSVSGRQICTSCLRELPGLQSACPRCAEPMPPSGNQLCGKCQKSPPAFDCVYSPYRYKEPVSSFILQLKFNQKLYIARIFGELLADYLEHALHEQPDMIVPVPMHPARLGSRGFNQALELARPVGEQLTIPVRPTVVRRTRVTPPQVGLNAKQRRQNTRGAFEASSQLQGSPTILLLDDVMTTGATADALARCLLCSGAAKVIVATVARAEDHA